MSIVVENRTPHCVSFYREDDTYTLEGKRYAREGALPYLIVPQRGEPFRATQSVVPDEPLSGLPTCRAAWTNPNLPAPEDGHYYIVSAITIHAARGMGRTTSDLLTVTDTVRDTNGRVIGCVRLTRN